MTSGGRVAGSKAPWPSGPRGPEGGNWAGRGHSRRRRGDVARRRDVMWAGVGDGVVAGAAGPAAGVGAVAGGVEGPAATAGVCASVSALEAEPLAWEGPAAAGGGHRAGDRERWRLMWSSSRPQGPGEEGTSMSESRAASPTEGGEDKGDDHGSMAPEEASNTAMSAEA